MPRYAPLPSVPLDPRNEAQIVQQASQRVYQASNQTLNDFSSGNPLAALIEGQAFAQGEFLFWANQLPDKILSEWIGPFLGAMRRLGTPAVARILVTIDPSDQPVTLPAGTRVSSDPNLTAGESLTFITNEAVLFAPGETTSLASVTSEYVGSLYNAPANSIVNAGSISIQGLRITNPQPATGGSDVETDRQVQDRFFTLIRRRNPVSATDWQNFFIDLYGLGALTSVHPNRSSRVLPDYNRDYLRSNGDISFFVLGPGAVELTDEQLSRGQNVVNFSTPVAMNGHLYPMTLSEVQYNLTVEVNANGPYSGNFKASSLSFRDILFSALTPGIAFPINAPPTVSEVDAAFYSAFPTTSRYVDPNIVSSVAYNTPTYLGKDTATYANIKEFNSTDNILNQKDLVVTTLPTNSYYPVEVPFTPYSSSKKDQTIYGNLQLKQIKELTPGPFSQGDVVYYAQDNYAGLRVILDNVNIGSSVEIPLLIQSGKISSVKTFTPWTVGSNYINNTSGILNPQLIAYDYASDEFKPTGAVPLSIRPGGFVWYVAKNFTLQPSTNDLTGALSTGNLGTNISVQDLLSGQTYTAGTWVKTPQVGSGPSQGADPYFFYVDVDKGAVEKFAYVSQTFTYTPDALTTSEYFDELVSKGVLEEVNVFNGDNGLPVFRYRARFSTGEYLEYRRSTGDTPSYFIAAKFFTPPSSNIQDMIDAELVYPLAPTKADSELLNQGLISGTVKKPVRMFTFFKGDQTFFREGTDIQAYVALESVSPMFEINVYVESGVFAPANTSTGEDFLTETTYIPYFNPEYLNHVEDIILSENGKNYYRVMFAFTPETPVLNWTNTQVENTCRYEEYVGNLLRIVRAFNCNEEILSQYGPDVSGIKLGIAQITLVPVNSGRSVNSFQEYKYVWENGAISTSVPQLSWYPGTEFQGNPPSYNGGTLAL